MHRPEETFKKEIYSGLSSMMKGFSFIGVVLLPLSLILMYRAFRNSEVRARLLWEKQQQEEAWHRDYVKKTSDSVFATDSAGRCNELNGAAVKLSGYSRKELLQMLIFDMVAPEAKEQKEEHVNQLVQSGSAGSDLLFLRKDGDKYHLRINSIKVHDQTFIHYCKDVTERKLSEQALEHIVKGTASETGEAFFNSLAQGLAQCLKVKAGMVVENLNIDPPTARTKSMWLNDSLVDNYDFLFEGTPCKRVVQGEISCVPENVQKLYPEDKYLATIDAESYLGVPMMAKHLS